MRYILIILATVCCSISGKAQTDSISKDTTLTYYFNELNYPDKLVFNSGKIGIVLFTDSLCRWGYIDIPPYTNIYVLGKTKERKNYICSVLGKLIYIPKDKKINQDWDKYLDDTCSIYRKYLALKGFRESALEVKDYYTKMLDYETKNPITVVENTAYDMSEYTDGTGFRCTIQNNNKKTIKYIWITFKGFNAVDDPVYVSSARGYSINKKCIGPIAQDETGSYDFEYAWLTDIVEYAKITSIKVQYMDLSTRTFTNLKDIILPKRFLLINKFLDKAKENSIEYINRL